MKKILLTGDRPTGALHLGHYVGSLQNRVEMQSQFETYILIADIQAYTDNHHQPEIIKKNILEVLADYLAVGIDPVHSSICLQSHMKGLFELTQYLSNLTSFDQLKHNPTLKIELAQKKINNLSFISYPVSQAADILGFRANCVPVGADQSPILELTNKLGQSFNKQYKMDLFPKVKGEYSICSRLMGIDGHNKMSKSLNNAIFLKDSADEIKKKVLKMYTDPLHLKVEQPGHLENNVVVYYLDIFDPDKKVLSELKNQYVVGGVADIVLKNRLIDVLDAFISPIRNKRLHLSQNEEYLLSILKQGTDSGNNKVEETMNIVRDIFCLKF